MALKSNDTTYKYGDRVIIDGKDVGEARYDQKTGKPLEQSAAPVAPTQRVARPVYEDEPQVFKARSEDELQRSMLSAASAELAGLNDYYNSLKTESLALGERNMRRTNSISTLTGLSGSTEASQEAMATDKATKSDLARIESERSVAINAVLRNIRTSAVEQARQERMEARQSEQDRISFREKAQASAVEQLSLLSKSSSGATLEGLKATLSPEEYAYLVRNAGGEAMVSAILFENRPQDTILGTPQVIGGKMVQAYKTPEGTVKYESVDLPEGVNPAEIKSIQKTDDGILIIKDDGTYSTIRGSGGSGTGKTTKGSVTSGGVVISAEQLGAGEARLQESMGPDGYVDPDVYQTAYNEWPGLKKDFLTRYPPNNYVNPMNTDLPQYLRSTKKAEPKQTSSSGRSL